MVNQSLYKMQISKVNEVYLTLKVDDSLEKELSDYFTFEVPGAKYMPHYRKKLWDGKIRLFSPHNGRIYVGLLPYIKEFCLKNSIEYILEDGVENERNVVREDVEASHHPYIPPQRENQSKYAIISWMRYTMQYPQTEHFYYLLPLLVSH